MKKQIKNKIILLIITLMTTVPIAFAEEEIKTQGEFNVLLSYAIKFSLGVVISSIIIAIGVWIYKQIMNIQKAKSTDSKADKFKCEIDDTQTIDEAIQTFLIINK